MAYIVKVASSYTNESMPGMVKLIYEDIPGDLLKKEHNLPFAYVHEFSKQIDEEKYNKIKSIISLLGIALEKDYYKIDLKIVKELFDLAGSKSCSRPRPEYSPRKVKEDMRSFLFDGQKILYIYKKNNFIGIYNFEDNSILYNGEHCRSLYCFTKKCSKSINPNFSGINGWEQCKKEVNGEWIRIKEPFGSKI
jgi:hypothetical protein